MADAERPVNLRAATASEGTGKTSYHVVKRGRFAACGADVLLGLSIPAADVPTDMRCRKSVCQRLFFGADEDASGVAPSHGETLPSHTPAPDSVKEQNND